MSKRTVKEINEQIAALEAEKAKLAEEEFKEKFEELKPILINTTLTIPQIKKAIKDAEAEKGEKKTRKPRIFAEKKCIECGNMFIPKSGRQVVCENCKNTFYNKDKEEKVKEQKERQEEFRKQEEEKYRKVIEEREKSEGTLLI